MEKKYSVKLSQLAEESDLHLEVAYAAPGYEEKLVNTADLNRPGLQILGYMRHFDESRLQVIGISENTLLTEWSHDARLRAFEAVMSRGIPGLIVSHEEPVLPECLEVAEKYGVSVLTTPMDTSEFYARLIGSLRRHLAPRMTIHGVLVEVHGEGMLITGDSGVGKSETALGLLKLGHRLIADDAVEILRSSSFQLEGRSPTVIQQFMELRGIGVINVPRLFGVGAMKPSCPIDMEVHLELWDQNKRYDRLGLDTETTEYLGVSLPMVTIPVRPGRNLAFILELAALTNRQKKSGYNAAEDLAQRWQENFT